VIEGALDEAGARAVGSFDDLYEADADARRIASALVERLAVGTA
jgi:hypothetical protein